MGTISAMKVAATVTAVAAATIFALDPTVQVAIIVSVPTTVVTLVLGLMNHYELKKHRDELHVIKVEMNGNMSRILDEKAIQGVSLTEKTTALAHAEGRREGTEAAEQRASDRKLPPE